MIKANELRIGNWVFINGNPALVTSIDEDGVNHYLNGSGRERHYKYGEIEPIPLTLEKAGFARTEEYQQDYSCALQLNARMAMVYYKGDASCLSIAQDGELIDLASGVCKYLHQLQNLSFALTGEELNIQL